MPPELLATPAPEASPRPARILVVDDDPCIRLLLREVLSDCEVSVFSSARAALKHLQSDGEVDVILSDVMMPQLDGLGFYRELTVEQQARTLFMTGGCPDELKRQLGSIGRPVLCKPFSFRALRTRLGLSARLVC